MQLMQQLHENNFTETTALPDTYFVSWPPYRGGYTEEQRSDSTSRALAEIRHRQRLTR